MAMSQEKLREVFNKLGIGKDGFITLEECAKLCDYFGMDEMDAQEMKQLYHNLDTSGDGKVSQKEFFVGMFRKDSLNEKNLKEEREAKKKAQSAAPKEPEETQSKPEIPKDPEKTKGEPEIPKDPEKTKGEPEIPKDPEKTKGEPEIPKDPEKTKGEPEIPKDPQKTKGEPEIPKNPEKTKGEPEIPKDPQKTKGEPEILKDPEKTKGEPEIPKDPEKAKSEPEKPKDPEKTKGEPEIPKDPEKTKGEPEIPKDPQKTKDPETVQSKTLATPPTGNSLDKKQHYATRPGASDWLNYLDTQGTGYIAGATVIDFWERLGISDGKKALEMLKFDPNGKIQPSDLSHALEKELKNPTDDVLHQIAVDTLLHSTDKFWNDNQDMAEEYGKMDEQVEELKKNLKDSEENQKALAQKKDLEIKLLQEANQKLRAESGNNASLPTPVPVEGAEDANKLEELEKQLEKSTEDCKKLKQRTFALESEVEKLRADLQTANDGTDYLMKENKELQEDLKQKAKNPNELDKSVDSHELTRSHSFDFDDSMPPEEVKKKVKDEMMRMQRMASKERKDAEGALLVEISDLERKHELEMEKMKADCEKEKADMAAAHKRELTDALANQEKALLTEFVVDKMNPPPGTPEEKILQLENDVQQKNDELKKQGEELAEKTKLLEGLSSKKAESSKDVSTETNNVDEIKSGDDATPNREDKTEEGRSDAQKEDEGKKVADLLSQLNEAELKNKELASAHDDEVKKLKEEHENAVKDLAEAEKKNKELVSSCDEVTKLKEDLEKDIRESKERSSSAKEVSTETDPVDESKAEEQEKKLVELSDKLNEVELQNKELTSSYGDEVKKLKEEHEKEVKDLMASHEAGLDKMKLSQQQLVLKHESDVTKLNKAHTDEVLNLQEEQKLSAAAAEQKLEDANKKIAGLDEDLKRQTEDLGEKTKLIDELSKEGVKIGNQETKLAELSNKLDEAELKNKELSLSRDDEVKKLKEKHDKVVEDLTKANNAELDKMKESQQEEMQTLSKRHDKELAGLKKSHKDEMSNLQEEQELSAAAGEQKLKDANKKIAGLTEEVSEMEGSVEALEQELAKREKEVAALNSSISQGEEHVMSKDKEIADKSEEMKKKDEKIADLEKQLNEIARKSESSEKDGNPKKELGEATDKLAAEYESKIQKMKKDHERELEDARVERQSVSSRDPGPRRFTLPPNETREARKKFSDIVKGYESKIAENVEGGSLENKSGEPTAGRLEKPAIAPPLQKNDDKKLSEVVQEMESKMDEMKKHFETEREGLERKHRRELDLAKEGLLSDYEAKIAETKKQAVREKEELENKYKVVEEALKSKEGSQEGKTSEPDSKEIADVVRDYDRKMTALEKRAEKEKKDLKEVYEGEMERMKKDSDEALARSGRIGEEKRDLGGSVRDDLEREILNLKLDNDRMASDLGRRANEIDENLREKYEDVIRDVRKVKDEEIGLLNDAIRSLRKQMNEQREMRLQHPPEKDSGFELLLKDHIDELSRENKKLREKNLQLESDVDALQNDGSKTESFQKLLLNNADLNAEKDLIKDQLKRTLAQLKAVTDALTAMTSQHREDKKGWALTKERLIDPDKYQELSSRLSKSEAANQRLQAMLERNQSEATKMLISTRDSYDREMKEVMREKEVADDQTVTMRKLLENKEKKTMQLEKNQSRSEHLLRDLYVENSRLLKHVQQLERQNTDLNSKVTVLEEKCLILGDLVRKLCPSGIH